MKPSAPPSVARSSIAVTIVQALSQLMSFAVYAVIAAIYGATKGTDAFFVALGIPAIFIGAVTNSVTSVFVPVLTHERVHRPEGLPRFVGAWLAHGIWLSIGLSVLLPAVMVVLERFEWLPLPPDLAPKVVRATVILSPLIAMQVVSSLLGAAHTIAERYTEPGIALLARYAVTTALLPALDPLLGDDALAVSFSLGGAVQIAWLSVRWKATQLPIKWNLGISSPLRSALRSALPMVAAFGLLQINLVVLRFLAAQLPTGSVSVLDYASRITFGITELLTGGVMTVLLAEWSKVVAHGATTALREELPRAIRWVAAGLLPLLGIIVLLRDPAVTLAFQRGAFDASLKEQTVAVLLLFLISVPWEVINRLYLRVTLVHRRTDLLAWAAFLKLTVSGVAAAVLMQWWDVKGLALGDTISVVVVTVYLALITSQLLGGDVKPWLSRVGLIAVCAAGPLVALEIGNRLLVVEHSLVVALVAAVLYTVSFILLSLLARIPEVRGLFTLLQRGRVTS